MLFHFISWLKQGGMHSPIHLTGHMASILHHGGQSDDELDSDSSYLSSRRDDLLSSDVAFARDWYMEVWRHCSKKEWQCRIDVKYPNPDWTFEAGLSNHQGLEELDLAPEEVVEEDGQVHPAEAWLLEHARNRSSSPTRWNKIKEHLLHAKEASKRRLSHTSISSHASPRGSKESLQARLHHQH